MKEILGITGIVILLIVLIGAGPMLTILSLNTLFGLNIAINFWSWLSMFWIQLVLGAGVFKRFSK